MSRKKKKKVADASQAMAQDAGEAPRPGRGWRRSSLLVAVPLLAASALAALSALPGYEDPNRSFNECHKRLGRLSTALMEWAERHEGLFPGSLRDLEDGYLPPGSGCLFECPESRGEYRYFGAGLEFNACDRAVVIACPEFSVHRYVFRGSEREPAELALYLGADLRIHAEHPDSSAADRRASIETAMKRRIDEQQLVLSLAAEASDAGAARRLHAIALDSSRLDETRALAAWATGGSENPGARRALHACLAASSQYTNAVGVSAAAALLGLDDTSGVEYLVLALDSENWSWRDAAARALEKKFSGTAPPMPPSRPYLSGAAKPGARSEIMEWWSRWKVANR